MTFREATIGDIPGMSVVRLAVKENPLNNPALVTQKDYEDYISIFGKGWICEIDGRIIGFSIVGLQQKNVWALFVDPDFEKMGIGRQLHDTMMDWYFTQTHEKIWLGTAPGTRAETFYKKSGWTYVGLYDKESKFEMTYEDWKNKNHF